MTANENRKYVFIGIFLFIGIVYWIKAFGLQVLNDDYRTIAENNALNKITLYPPRSNVYDRRNELLAYNINIYNLVVFPKDVKNLDTAEFCDILDIDSLKFKKLMYSAIDHSKVRKNNNEYNRSAVFYARLNKKQLIQLQENLFRFKGFFIEPSTERYYALEGAAHLMGYLTEADEAKLNEDLYYRPGDLVGASGIEYEYESMIRGSKGYKTVWQDRLYRERGLVKSRKAQVNPKPGPEFRTTLDYQLQQYGELLLNGKRGSVVAIEPSTGEILALVNKPDYNPNILNGSERSKNYRKLLIDERRPLYNRAIKGQYPPGSTFKTVMAAIGMQEGIVADTTRFSCAGGYRMGRTRVGCHPHSSPLDLRNSIRISCNAYYCKLYRAFIDAPKFGTVREGFKKLTEHWRSFGLGEPLGIDLPGEKGGNIPTLAALDRHHGKSWRSSTIISMSIGQGEILLTPLQIANVACIMANRGYYYTPHLIKGVGPSDVTPTRFTERHNTSVDKKHFDVVVDGMEMVTKPGGTAGRTGIKGIVICGKTGTAQNSHGKDHSLFIAFAPKDNPQIAVAAIVENGGYGSSWAAPICNLMIEKYLNGKEKDFKTVIPHLEKRMINTSIK